MVGEKPELSFIGVATRNILKDETGNAPDAPYSILDV